MLIIRPPLDADRLKVAIADVNQVQFDEALTESEYRLLAQILEQHPQIVMRAYGFDMELASLDFLKFFPKLYRFSMARLHNVTDVEPLNALSDDLVVLDVGETQKPLDLRPLKFRGLHHLRVSGHTRGLPELLANNPHLRRLSMLHLKADKILAATDLPPNLEALDLTLGSAQDLSSLARLPNLRHLSLRQVRGIDDSNLTALGDLPRLEWLWLDTLSGVTKAPDLRRNEALMRVDLDGMSKLRDDESLQGLAHAPSLREVSITSSKLPVSAIAVLANHPTLSAITIGLGSANKNKQAEALLSLPHAASVTSFARRHEI